KANQDMAARANRYLPVALVVEVDEPAIHQLHANDLKNLNWRAILTSRGRPDLLPPSTGRNAPSLRHHPLPHYHYLIRKVDCGTDMFGEKGQLNSNGRSKARAQAHKAMLFIHPLDNPTPSVHRHRIPLQPGVFRHHIATKGL